MSNTSSTSYGELVRQPTRLFPYGRYSEGTVPCLFVAKDEIHRHKVITAFPVTGAMYTSGLAMLTGWRFDKAIIWEPDYLAQSYMLTAQWNRWIKDIVRATLSVGHTEELYIV